MHLAAFKVVQVTSTVDVACLPNIWATLQPVHALPMDACFHSACTVVMMQVPLIGFIGRLDYQKGADLVLGAAPWLLNQDVQIVCLGTGDKHLEVMPLLSCLHHIILVINSYKRLDFIPCFFPCSYSALSTVTTGLGSHHALVLAWAGTDENSFNP